MKTDTEKWESDWVIGKELYWLESIRQVIEYGCWMVYSYKDEDGLTYINTGSSSHLYDCLRDEEWRNSLSDEEYFDLANHTIPHDFPGL